jgi:VWFA-related protein
MNEKWHNGFLVTVHRVAVKRPTVKCLAVARFAATSRYALVAVSVGLLAGQTPSTTVTPSPTFKVSTRLIQVNVIVHDKKGDPALGLTKDQFTLFDQGAAQRIVFFSDQCSSQQPDQPAAVAAKAAGSGGTNVFSNRPEEGAAAPGSVTAILFDSLNTDFLDTGFARARVEKFLKGIQPGDRVALYGLSTKLLVLHDFTGDADALAQALEKFKAIENAETSATKFKESNISAGPVGYSASVDGAINDMNQKRADLFMGARVQATASALEAIAKHLAGLPGRKNLIWVSGSFPMNIGIFQRRLQGTRPEKEGFSAEVNAAARALSGANVAIYPVDARAMTTLGGVFNAATSPVMTARQLQNSAGRPGDLAPIRDVGTMQTLADATGGRVFENTNDIEGAVRSAIDDSRCTYVLGYYPDHNKWDGTFREIKVQAKHAGVETRYRRGYVAFPEAPLDQTRAPLTAANVLAGQIESTELGLTLQIEPQAGPARAREIKAHLRFDAAAMRFEEKDGRWTDDLDVLWVQLDAKGGLVVSNGQTLTLKLSPETYHATAGNGVKMSTVEGIADQTAQLRFVARDRGTGAEGSVTIPVGALFGQAQ